MKTLQRKTQARRVHELWSEDRAQEAAQRQEDDADLDVLHGPDPDLGEAVGVVTREKPTRAARRAANREDKARRREEQTRDREAQNADRWFSGKRNWLLNYLGAYEAGRQELRSTTRQLEAAQLVVSEAPTASEGLMIGVESDGDWPVMHDPFSAYGRGVQNPNVVTIGDVGVAKSSLQKTWAILRPLTLGRRCVVIDKKSQEDEDGADLDVGEYTPLARLLGVEPIKFVVGGGPGSTCINLLDPIISTGGLDPSGSAGEGKPATQEMMLRSVVVEILGRPLDALEGKALRVAHKRAVADAQAEGRVAIISDIVEAMLKPREADAETFGETAETLRRWGRSPAFELERMIDGDLAGLVDGETSEHVKLNSGLMVFDVSSLPEDGPALSVVMTIISTWLTNMLQKQAKKVPTHLIVEEAWHLVRGSFANVTRKNTKLSRALSLASFFAFHHISDVPEGSPAIAMIRECDTIFVYRQSRLDDGQMVQRLFDFPEGTAELLAGMEPGVSLCKIGTAKPFVLHHERSEIEKVITSTDAAMLSEARVGV
ncbi:hypothetical protein [Kocuria palustris]|nr:hypothetical protein [Kocuria palustris]